MGKTEREIDRVKGWTRMIIYISGKIKNNPNYKEDFANAEKVINEVGHTPLNPPKLDLALPKLSYEKYMRIDYALIDIADCIYMLSNWQDSNGAKAEHAYAKSLGKEIIYEEEYLEPIREVDEAIKTLDKYDEVN